MPTGVKVVFALLGSALFYVFFIMFSPQEGTRQAFTALDQERMKQSIQYAMDIVSMFGRTPKVTVNAEPMAQLVVESMNKIESPSPQEIEASKDTGGPRNAPISYFVGKVHGPWQVAVIPLENPCRIQYKGFGYDLNKPLIEFTQDCLVTAP